MDIKDIKNKKDLLENEIKQKVLSFEEETSACVASIRVVHIDGLCNSPLSVVSDIHIK